MLRTKNIAISKIFRILFLFVQFLTCPKKFRLFRNSEHQIKCNISIFDNNGVRKTFMKNTSNIYSDNMLCTKILKTYKKLLTAMLLKNKTFCNFRSINLLGKLKLCRINLVKSWNAFILLRSRKSHYHFQYSINMRKFK